MPGGPPPPVPLSCPTCLRLRHSTRLYTRRRIVPLLLMRSKARAPATRKRCCRLVLSLRAKPVLLPLQKARGRAPNPRQQRERETPEHTPLLDPPLLVQTEGHSRQREMAPRLPPHPPRGVHQQGAPVQPSKRPVPLGRLHPQTRIAQGELIAAHPCFPCARQRPPIDPVYLSAPGALFFFALHVHSCWLEKCSIAPLSPQSRTTHTHTHTHTSSISSPTRTASSYLADLNHAYNRTKMHSRTAQLHFVSSPTKTCLCSRWSRRERR
jgi:hypothetical protein